MGGGLLQPGAADEPWRKRCPREIGRARKLLQRRLFLGAWPTDPILAMNATSTWTALRNRVFRKLWLASVASGCGVAAHDRVATWVMNALSPPPVLLSLLSTAASLPFFLLTFPVGALAGVVDRKKLLCAMHLWLAAVAGGLALLGGSTGLYSTLEDLGRFGQILCAGGQWGGARLLGRKTLGLMRANHLVGAVKPPAIPSSRAAASGSGWACASSWGWSSGRIRWAPSVGTGWRAPFFGSTPPSGWCWSIWPSIFPLMSTGSLAAWSTRYMRAFKHLAPTFRNRKA